MKNSTENLAFEENEMKFKWEVASQANKCCRQFKAAQVSKHWLQLNQTRARATFSERIFAG